LGIGEEGAGIEPGAVLEGLGEAGDAGAGFVEVHGLHAMHGQEAGAQRHLVGLTGADEGEHFLPGRQVQATEDDACGVQSQQAAPDALPGGLEHHHHQVARLEWLGQGHRMNTSR
jgi:hypothetical protein